MIPPVELTASLLVSPELIVSDGNLRGFAQLHPSEVGPVTGSCPEINSSTGRAGRQEDDVWCGKKVFLRRDAHVLQ